MMIPRQSSRVLRERRARRPALRVPGAPHPAAEGAGKGRAGQGNAANSLPEGAMASEPIVRNSITERVVCADRAWPEHSAWPRSAAAEPADGRPAGEVERPAGAPQGRLQVQRRA